MHTTIIDDITSILHTNHGDDILYVAGKVMAGFTSDVGYFAEKGSLGNAEVQKYLRAVKRVQVLSQAEIEHIFLGDYYDKL